MEVLPVELDTLGVVVERQLDIAGLQHLLLERVQVEVGRLGLLHVVSRLGGHQWDIRGSPDRNSWREPSGPPGSTSSILLLLQLVDAGSLLLAEVLPAAVTEGVGVVSSGSTLNKTKEIRKQK